MKSAGMLFGNIDLYYFHKADFNRFSEVTKSIEKDHFFVKKIPTQVLYFIKGIAYKYIEFKSTQTFKKTMYVSLTECTF